MSSTTYDCFNFYASDSRLPEPVEIITKYRNDAPLTEAEAQNVLEWVVSETRFVLNNVMDREGLQRTDKLHGRCSFSQAVAAYGLIDRGIQVHPFSVQSLSNHTVGHALLSIVLSGRIYVIDPTFRQFCDPEKPEYNGLPMPGYVLAATESGPEIVGKLLTDGYIEMTLDVAGKYLASFCNGVDPFSSHEAIVAFLRKPPYDGVYDHFDKRIMERGGYLIPANPATCHR